MDQLTKILNTVFMTIVTIALGYGFTVMRDTPTSLAVLKAELNHIDLSVRRLEDSTENLADRLLFVEKKQESGLSSLNSRLDAKITAP